MSRLKRGAVAIAFIMTCFIAQGAQRAGAFGSEFDIGLNGRVSMEGSILSSACDIATEDRYQTVKMPSETHGHIKRIGIGPAQHFYIHLVNCSFDTTGSNLPLPYMQIIFDGDEDNGMFRLAGDVGGMALELLDKYGEVIRPGTAISNRELIIDDNRLDFQLRLKKTTGDVNVGNYHAMIRYRLEYF